MKPTYTAPNTDKTQNDNQTNETYSNNLNHFYAVFMAEKTIICLDQAINAISNEEKGRAIRILQSIKKRLTHVVHLSLADKIPN